MRVRSTAIVGMIGALVIAACGSSGSGSATDTPKGGCPTAPVPVVVSVDQWGDIVDQLAGDCGDVSTIFRSSSADPHDYEPTPADSAELADAKLVVVNGLGYDSWATRALATVDERPAVVDGGEVVGLRDGANPHLWYGPDHVTAIADAVTAELGRLSPRAKDYFERRRSAWQTSMRPYFDEVARIKAVAARTTYGATEGIFSYMADAVGLENRTPSGYRHATDNESEPAPGDMHAFEQALADGDITVLVFNRQTQGAIPEQIRDRARDADVPIVNVTESVPPEFDTFAAWQVSQLEDLAKALGT